MRGPIPVTVVTGFLGSGKTSLIRHVLSGDPPLRLGVLVNDFGALNIDAALISAVSGDVLALTNGCLCCSIKNDLVRTLLALVERPDPPDHVLIETSGLSDPGAVLELFAELEGTGAVRVDGVLTMVDAENFAPADRDRGALTKAQIRAADLVVIGKVDLVSEARAAEVEAAVRALRPEARILRAVEGAVALEVLLGVARAPAPPHEHAPPNAFQSMVFRAARPVSFRALAPALTALPAEVFRVKGFVDAVERPDQRVIVELVGRRLFVRTEPSWAGETPRTELVLIGRSLDEAAIEASLRASELA